MRPVRAAHGLWTSFPRCAPHSPRVAASPNIESLYIHVPFCAHKCGYCAFYSAPPSGDLVSRYVAALVRELEIVAADLRPRTVFFGGGTPSLLNLRQWETIFRAMERLGLLGAQEWTVECNPATVSADKAALLRSFGVNRVSMGVQSLDDALLDRLGRIHSREQVFKSFDILRAAGFDNINLDLMFAIPGQTMGHWRATLDEIAALGSEHLSSYEVIYEEDTALYAQLQAGEFDVDEELAAAMFDELIQRAAHAGFVQYEVANFARDMTSSEISNLKYQVSGNQGIPARACLHNIAYWRGHEFHGLGPGASGFTGGVRTKNFANTQLYCERLEQGHRAIESRDELPPLARAGEIAGFGLRMNAGWPFADFTHRTGFDMRREWRAEMERLKSLGYAAERDEDAFHLTPTGLRYADWAAELFLRPATA
jgi:oxygen-independent coproporphyrinogen-3 oxidase